MNDGSYLLVGYPQGEPAAFMVGEDADLLRKELERVFRNPEDRENSNGTMVPENNALRTEKVQS